jgi:hypothetical protein
VEAVTKFVEFDCPALYKVLHCDRDSDRGLDLTHSIRRSPNSRARARNDSDNCMLFREPGSDCAPWQSSVEGQFHTDAQHAHSMSENVCRDGAKSTLLFVLIFTN